jgi:hypothetical protein
VLGLRLGVVVAAAPTFAVWILAFLNATQAWRKDDDTAWRKNGDTAHS